MTDPTPPTLAQPKRGNLFHELVSPLYMTGLPLFMTPKTKQTLPSQELSPVMVIPGFGANDISMAPLRLYLRKYGFKTQGWGLGLNLGGKDQIDSLSQLSDRWDIDRDHSHQGEGEVPYLCDRVADRVKKSSEKLGRPLSLVGWSLGGYIAREVARDLPDHVDKIVTMGSPVIGGPKYTRTATIFEKRNFDLDWLEAETVKRHERPITQPITLIYSKRDGVVGWQAAQDRFSPNVTHHEIDCAHMAMGLNHQIMRLTRDALLEPVSP